MPCSITAVSTAFPGATLTVEELSARGLLASDPALLRSFGFGRVHVAEEESAYDLALSATRSLLERETIDPESIDLLVYGGACAAAFATPAGAGEAGARFGATRQRFNYPATRLQSELGLSHAAVLGVSQLACTSLFGCVRIASALLAAEGLGRALCISSELVPRDAGREALWNCTSDAACALLLEPDGPRNRIHGQASVTKGWHWDCESNQEEAVAAYFPTARHVIDQALARAGWTAAQVDWVLPHNVSRRSWEILLGVARLSGARLFDRRLALDGHTLSGDNFINLGAALESGAVRPGEKLLLFSYGYGAHWTALAVEA
jgi:3-oxoacyl-[acyl-carrier-protein] synthase-3